MQSLTSIFADNRLLALAAAIAAFLLFAVLVLLIVRLLFGNRLRMSGGRGRQQRLGVVDAFDMDRQRQLVLVRRDNTEHLVMIGGPNDLLIESTIIRAEMRERSSPAAREATGQEAARLPVPESWAPPASPAAPTMANDPIPEPALAPARTSVEATSPTMSTPTPVPSAPAPIVRGETSPPSPPNVSPLAPSPGLEEAYEVPATRPVIPRSPLRPPEPADASAPAERAPRAAPPKVDIFARLRGRGTPPTPVPPPPAPVEKPPVADADFFETEIAKALAPSVRARPDLSDVVEPVHGSRKAPPPSPIGVDDERPTIAETDAAPVPAPRPPFRPFAPRREPALNSDGNTPAAMPPRPIPPRPPPPIFAPRPNFRPKERSESSEASTQSVPTPEVSLSSPPPSTEPQVEPMHEPLVSPAPQPVAEATDPFEEEMARLLGRSPGKDG